MRALSLTLCLLGLCLCVHIRVGRAITVATRSTQHGELVTDTPPSAPHPWAAAAAHRTARHEAAARAPLSSEEGIDGSQVWQRVLPFASADAVVIRPATAAEARAACAAVFGDEDPPPDPSHDCDYDELWEASRPERGGGARALLHGRRRQRAYTECNACTLIRCMPGPRPAQKVCTGHCRKQQRLFTCTSRGALSAKCATPPEDRPDPLTLPPDALSPLQSAVVTVPAPFIGCANITGTPNGCPAPSTLGTSPTHGGVQVLSASCIQHLYSLPCAEGSRRTLFLPFGYCLCVLYAYEIAQVVSEPCRASDFGGITAGALAAGGESEGDDEDVAEVPVSVRADPGRNVTVTEFGLREEADPETFAFEHEFNTSSGSVKVVMSMYQSFPVRSVNVTAEGPLGEEEQGVGDDGAA